MRAKDAKQLDFRLLLQKMGYSPVQGGIKKGGDEIWYKSPLNHSDNTASFHITKGHTAAWVFNCFSTGEKGTIIDFVIAHSGNNVHDIKTALAYLREQFPGTLFEDHSKRTGNNNIKPQTSFSFHKQNNNPININTPPLVADRQLEYLEDLPLKSGQLLHYLLHDRKIPIHLSQKYLRLVRYKNLKHGKTFYAIGLRNRAGGFEIRAGSSSYSFKSALIARDISVIKGGDSSQCLVVEGMVDALSHMVMEGDVLPPYDLIVMHSVNTYVRCSNFIKEQGYKLIHTALDNDNTGKKCTARFKEEYGLKTISHSLKFSPHKDLNKALQMGEIIQLFTDNDFVPKTQSPSL